MTPDINLAIKKITATCDWFHLTKKKGGYGYSIAQVKKTNAYEALVALGGTWPVVSTTHITSLPLLLNGV